MSSFFQNQWDAGRGTSSTVQNEDAPTSRGHGRGRAQVLPAWMTRSQVAGGSQQLQPQQQHTSAQAHRPTTNSQFWNYTIHQPHERAQEYPFMAAAPAPSQTQLHGSQETLYGTYMGTGFQAHQSSTGMRPQQTSAVMHLSIPPPPPPPPTQFLVPAPPPPPPDLSGTYQVSDEHRQTPAPSPAPSGAWHESQRHMSVALGLPAPEPPAQPAQQRQPEASSYQHHMFSSVQKQQQHQHQQDTQKYDRPQSQLPSSSSYPSVSSTANRDAGWSSSSSWNRSSNAWQDPQGDAAQGNGNESASSTCEGPLQKSEEYSAAVSALDSLSRLESKWNTKDMPDKRKDRRLQLEAKVRLNSDDKTYTVISTGNPIGEGQASRTTAENQGEALVGGESAPSKEIFEAAMDYTQTQEAPDSSSDGDDMDLASSSDESDLFREKQPEVQPESLHTLIDEGRGPTAVAAVARSEHPHGTASRPIVVSGESNDVLAQEKFPSPPLQPAATQGKKKVRRKCKNNGQLGDSWTRLVKASIQTAPTGIRSQVEAISKFNRIPKKAPKFRNFMIHNIGEKDPGIISRVWNYVCESNNKNSLSAQHQRGAVPAAGGSAFKGQEIIDLTVSSPERLSPPIPAEDHFESETTPSAISHMTTILTSQIASGAGQNAPSAAASLSSSGGSIVAAKPPSECETASGPKTSSHRAHLSTVSSVAEKRAPDQKGAVVGGGGLRRVEENENTSIEAPVSRAKAEDLAAMRERVIRSLKKESKRSTSDAKEGVDPKEQEEQRILEARSKVLKTLGRKAALRKEMKLNVIRDDGRTSEERELVEGALSNRAGVVPKSTAVAIGATSNVAAASDESLPAAKLSDSVLINSSSLPPLEITALSQRIVIRDISKSGPPHKVRSLGGSSIGSVRKGKKRGTKSMKIVKSGVKSSVSPKIPNAVSSEAGYKTLPTMEVEEARRKNEELQRNLAVLKKRLEAKFKKQRSPEPSGETKNAERDMSGSLEFGSDKSRQATVIQQAKAAVGPGTTSRSSTPLANAQTLTMAVSSDCSTTPKRSLAAPNNEVVASLRKRQRKLRQEIDISHLKNMVSKQKEILVKQKSKLNESKRLVKECNDEVEGQGKIVHESEEQLADLEKRRALTNGMLLKATRKVLDARKKLSEEKAKKRRRDPADLF